MASLLQTDLVECRPSVEFERVPYRAPLKFGGRIVSSGWLMNVRMQVVTRGGRVAEGVAACPAETSGPGPQQNSALTRPSRPC
jgi:hypothetical protein